MSIPTYFRLGRDHFTPRGASDCSRDEIEFEKSPLQREWSGFEIPKNQPMIQDEVNKLLEKDVVVECEHEAVEYISPLFLREKTNGTERLILNLKNLNKYLEYKHFGQTLRTILTLIQPNCYIVTIDLKDAYYSVKIEGNDTYFLNFFVITNFCSLLSCPVVCHQVLESLRN